MRRSVLFLSAAVFIFGLSGSDALAKAQEVIPLNGTFTAFWEYCSEVDEDTGSCIGEFSTHLCASTNLGDLLFSDREPDSSQWLLPQEGGKGQVLVPDVTARFDFGAEGVEPSSHHDQGEESTFIVTPCKTDVDCLEAQGEFVIAGGFFLAGIFNIEGQFEISSGTGRFANATGKVFIASTLSDFGNCLTPEEQEALTGFCQPVDPDTFTGVCPTFGKVTGVIHIP